MVSELDVHSILMLSGLSGKRVDACHESGWSATVHTSSSYDASTQYQGMTWNVVVASDQHRSDQNLSRTSWYNLAILWMIFDT